MKLNWYHISTGQFGYPQPEDTFLEETYDLSNACPTCSIGKQQNNPFRFLSEPKAKRSMFVGLNWIFDEIFVRGAVRQIFEDEEVTGIRFSRPLRHKTSEPLESIYQMHVDTFLPTALRGEKLRTEKCEMPKDPSTVRFLRTIESKLVEGPFCGAIKYNYPQGPEEYIDMPMWAFESVPDVVRMNEWFGSGGATGRPILASQRVKKIVERMKWRGLTFNPIKVTDE